MITKEHNRIYSSQTNHVNHIHHDNPVKKHLQSLADLALNYGLNFSPEIGIFMFFPKSVIQHVRDKTSGT